MSKFAKGKSWIEHRLSGDLQVDGTHYTASLLARKGTGFAGFRVTAVFLPHAGGAPVEVDLPPASSTADIHRLTRELAADPDHLARLCREARSP